MAIRTAVLVGGSITALGIATLNAASCSPFSADAESDAGANNGSSSSSSGTSGSNNDGAVTDGSADANPHQPFCTATPAPSADHCFDFGGTSYAEGFDDENFAGVHQGQLDTEVFLSPPASFYSHIEANGDGSAQSIARLVKKLGSLQNGIYQFAASVYLDCDGDESMTVLELYCADTETAKQGMLLGVGIRANDKLILRARPPNKAPVVLESQYPQKRWFEIRAEIDVSPSSQIKFEVDGASQGGPAGDVHCSGADGLVFLVGLQGRYSGSKTCSAYIDNVTISYPP